MKIQTLIFDLDGTAIAKTFDGMPSPAVVEAVKQAKKHCHVSVATGRPYRYAEKISTA